MFADKYYNAMTDKARVDVLRESGHYVTTPVGVSMWPMLKSREDVVEIVEAEGVLKKYDVALYYRPSDRKCVLHRVLKVNEDTYDIYGDNCTSLEIVPHDAVIGVARQFYKNGKWIPVTSKKYMLYVHLWCDLLPLRLLFLRVRNRLLRKRVKNDR